MWHQMKKVILGHKTNAKPAWTTGDPVPEKERKGRDLSIKQKYFIENTNADFYVLKTNHGVGVSLRASCIPGKYQSLSCIHGPSERWSCGLWMSWQSSLKTLAEREGCKLRFCGSSSTTRRSDWFALSSAGPVCLHSAVLCVPPFMSLLHLFHTVLFRLWPCHHLPTLEFLKVSLKKKLFVIGMMTHTLWTPALRR